MTSTTAKCSKEVASCFLLLEGARTSVGNEKTILMEGPESCIEDELWRRSNDSEVALGELRGRLTTLRSQLDIILRKELGLPQAIELLDEHAAELQPQALSAQSLIEQQVEAQLKESEDEQGVMPTSLLLPSKCRSDGDTFGSNLGQDGIMNIVLKQDFDSRLENVDTKMRWLSESIVEAHRGVEGLRTEISAANAVINEIHDRKHMQAGLNSFAEGDDLRALETCLSPCKDGNTRTLSAGNLERPPMPPAQESFDAAQFLTHTGQKHVELQGLIQAESGARADLMTVVLGLREKVDQVSAYQDNLLKSVEQQADKLAHLQVTVDEVCTRGTPFAEREERTGSLQDFRSEILARCSELCKGVGDELALFTKAGLQDVRTQLENGLTAQLSEVRNYVREMVPEVSGKLGDTTLLHDLNRDAMTRSAESITWMASNSRNFDSNTGAGIRTAHAEQAALKARAQSVHNMITKAFGRSVTCGMFENVVGTWTYESSAGKKTFTITRDGQENLVFRQPIICEIEGCCFMGVFFPKEIDDVKWACARLRDKDNLVVGDVRLRYDEKFGGLSVLFHGLLGVDIETIALPTAQTEPLTDGSVNELEELRKIRGCKMFNLVSKALELEPKEATNQCTMSVKPVKSDRSAISIPEVDDGGMNERVEDDLTFTDEEFRVMKEKTRKIFDVVSKCWGEDAIAQFKEVRSAERRQLFAEITDFLPCILPCVLCCVSKPQDVNIVQSYSEPRPQHLGLPHQEGTSPVEIAPVVVENDGFDAAPFRLNHTMFALVTRALSAEGHYQVQNAAQDRKLQKQKVLESTISSALAKCTLPSFGQPSWTPSSRSVVPTSEENDMVGSDRGFCENRGDAPLLDGVEKMLMLVKKVTGSDLSVNPVLPSVENVSKPPSAASPVIRDEEFLARRQKNKKMLSIVIKAGEQPSGGPPGVTADRFTADASRVWKMLVSLRPGRQGVELAEFVESESAESVEPI